MNILVPVLPVPKNHDRRSLSNTISRYNILLDVLRFNSYPTLANLRDALDKKDLGVSERTMQRLIEQVRYEFKVDIVYEPTHRGYYIDRQNSPGYEKLLKLFYLNQKSNLVAASFDGSSKFISFENDGEAANIAIVPELIKAIENCSILHILHHRFDRKKEFWIKVKPYMIKEYNNRFYLVAKNMKDQVRVYGLERIKAFKCEGESFNKENNFDPEAYYSNVIGIFYDGEPCEKVVLSFDPLAAQYVRSIKWHSTQTEEDRGAEVIVTMYVHVNFELIQKILSWGSQVTVLEPQSLVDKIKQEISTLCEKYV